MDQPWLADLPGWAPYSFAPQPASTVQLMPQWPRLHVSYPLIHGFSRLGHVFLSDEPQHTCAVLYPLHGGTKGYPSASFAEFGRAVLSDVGFQSYIFPTDLVRPIVRRLGPVAPTEVYFPVPYPSLGGSGAPETYQSGDVWVFLDLVGAMWLDEPGP